METTLLTIAQMRDLYPNEWLLVACTEIDDNLDFEAGEVIAHSPDRDLIYAAIATARTTRQDTLAIEYTGNIPDDYAFILCLSLSRVIGHNVKQLAKEGS